MVVASEYLPWLAVLGCWLTFGSFAVPMKWKSVVDADVHPLVYQLYKTTWTFATSHLVLFFLPYEFTWWGLLSGLSWVPSGVAAIIAVQNVGIAVGQATWQITIILTSCVWGFLVFRNEDVYSVWATVGAFLCLVFGVVGMTLSFNLKVVPTSSLSTALASTASNAPPGSRPDLTSSPERVIANSTLRSSAGSSELRLSGLGTPRSCSRQSLSDIRFGVDDVTPRAAGQEERPKTSMALGIAAAVFNGTWGGSNLVPSKYAPLHGIHFVISFATGAMIVNLLLLVLYASWIKVVRGDPFPKLHFRVMALPGFLSGTLWSVGNFCSLYVVNSALGQGIGYSLVQSSVICSGLWGICFYRELSGRPVLYWSLCCCVCLAGVALLAIEKKST